MIPHFIDKIEKSEELNNFPKVTELVNGGAGMSNSRALSAFAFQTLECLVKLTRNNF